ncbi:MAG: hypothetical protein KDD35_01640 [Bdellovibrionales bacterium]|nr:hypothetical protein [Bdellovibrionales bacterium]
MDRTQISRFFLVIPPGLESLALEELQVKSRLLAEDSSLDYSGVNLQQAEVVSGGIELNLALKEGWILNNYLRIPTRILQRLERFRCRDYSQIKKKVSRWPWYQYLRDGEIRVHVSSHNSRLNMKKRLVSSVVEGIGEAKKRQAFRKPHLEIPQNIYIRIEADQATLSLDTSGEFLFRRGYKEYVTKAPMRETLASALYWLASAGQKVEPMALQFSIPCVDLELFAWNRFYFGKP